MNELVFWPILIALGAITIGSAVKAVEAMRACKLADDECGRLRAQLHLRNDQDNKRATDSQPRQTSTVNLAAESNSSASPQTDILHCILALITKYQAQNEAATPKRISEDMSLDSAVVLAYMWKFHNEQLVTFNSVDGGGKPNINTPFFLSPKAWQHIKVAPA